jgi:DNA-3-methyladenine glycosylase I
MKRCSWVNEDKLYQDYHDEEWGVAVHDDRVLFEFLILEGAQAGLSWITILKKRENYRKAFDGFDFEKIALYGEDDVERLMGNEGIVRNRLKINSAVRNAKVFISIRKEFGSFDKYIWGFVEGRVVDDKIRNMKDIPATTDLSDEISKDLKKRGMNFVGSTIIYAFLQAVGIVNDHEVGCSFRN